MARGNVAASRPEGLEQSNRRAVAPEGLVLRWGRTALGCRLRGTLIPELRRIASCPGLLVTLTLLRNNKEMTEERVSSFQKKIDSYALARSGCTICHTDSHTHRGPRDGTQRCEITQCPAVCRPPHGGKCWRSRLRRRGWRGMGKAGDYGGAGGRSRGVE